MKKKMIIKLFLIVALMATSCNRDDDNKDDQGCLKEENYFEAEFDGQTLEPYFLASGSTRFYTLNLSRCSENQKNWSLSINTDDDIGLYLYLVNISANGAYSISAGENSHVQATCDNSISLYLSDDRTNEYTFISSGNGELQINEYDENIGLFSGVFSCEMISTVDTNEKKIITGKFNVNKSTLNNFERPCWL